MSMTSRFAPEAAGAKLNNCEVSFSLRSAHRRQIGHARKVLKPDIIR
jgi:hypothetical protein